MLRPTSPVVVIAFLSLIVCVCEALVRDRFLPQVPIGPEVGAPDIVVLSQDGAQLPPYNTFYYFDQLKDHKDPAKGTFKMRYFFTWERYQPGGPIILSYPGEDDLEYYPGYITNRTIMGQVSQALHGANIAIEHRFFGESNPGPDLSADSLSVLTLEQAIDDLVYFAQNVKLPMPGGDDVSPDKAAWLLFGGSYAGALTAWTMQSRPGIFWAGYASSAVVQAVNYFWAYNEPIRQFMAKNCSADVQAVISHVDQLMSTGSSEDQQAFKELFGLTDLTHNDDVAAALVNNIGIWQYQGLSPDGNTDFQQLCEALEVDEHTGELAPATGFGLDHALKAWGSHFTTEFAPSWCEPLNFTVAECFGTYNLTQKVWSDTSLGQWSRSWFWMICNEFGWWQTGAPEGWPTLVTRLAPPSYWLRQCVQLWPDYFKEPPVPNVDGINRKYDGWDISVDRLFFANGQRDPWREVTVSSDFHTRKSTARQPIYVGEGFHSGDIRTSEGVANPSIKAIQNLGVAHMGLWVQEWRALHPDVPAISNFTTPDPAQLPLPPPFVPATIPDNIVNAPPPPLPSNFPTTP